MAGAADAHHHLTALAAEQLFRQQVVGLRILVGGRLLVVFQHLLHLVEHLRLHDGRYSPLQPYLVLIGVYADILLIFQHRPQAVVGEWPAPQGA